MRSLRTHLAILRFRLRGHTFHARPLGWFASRLEQGEPFSFARYGDGEWNAILGVAGANCDGHQYFPELSRDLEAALRAPGRYQFGVQPLALKVMGDRIHQWCQANKVSVAWCDADVLHDANKAGRLLPLVKALRRHPVVLVGPPHLASLDAALFPVARFIQIPAKDCSLEKARILAEVTAALEQATAPTVVAFSASMLANVLIHELFPRFGGRHWLLDLGSLWDVYAGVRSRGVYQDRDWARLIARNTGAAG
jgi:hypothetical protein